MYIIIVQDKLSREEAMNFNILTVKQINGYRVTRAKQNILLNNRGSITFKNLGHFSAKCIH